MWPCQSRHWISSGWYWTRRRRWNRLPRKARKCAIIRSRHRCGRITPSHGSPQTQQRTMRTWRFWHRQDPRKAAWCREAIQGHWMPERRDISRYGRMMQKVQILPAGHCLWPRQICARMPLQPERRTRSPLRTRMKREQNRLLGLRRRKRAYMKLPRQLVRIQSMDCPMRIRK